jgi:hypothetical protein
MLPTLASRFPSESQKASWPSDGRLWIFPPFENESEELRKSNSSVLPLGYELEGVVVVYWQLPNEALGEDCPGAEGRTKFALDLLLGDQRTRVLAVVPAD